MHSPTAFPLTAAIGAGIGREPSGRPTMRASTIVASQTKIGAAIGMELTGVDLRLPTSDVMATLQDAVDRHHVVVIHDQFLDAHQLQALAQSLGPIVISPVQRVAGSNRAV